MRKPTISSQISAIEIAIKIISGAIVKPRNPSVIEKLLGDLGAVVPTLLEVEQERARQAVLDGDGGQR